MSGEYEIPAPHATGFDVRPSRPVPVTMALFVVVVLAAAAFAHVFRDTSQWLLERYAGERDPTAAAASLSRLVLFVVVMGAVVVAAYLGRSVDRRWGSHVGVEAVASSARGEGRTISARATTVRSIATWTVSSGLVSIGRESAIIETGGAIGAIAGRRTGGRGDAMATAGIAAAFAAAYHAPVAAVFYLEEHLGVRRSRRALMFASLGALGGHLASVGLLGGEEIFPGTQGSRWEMLGFALIGLLPAVAAARLFLQLRTRVRGGWLADQLGIPTWLAIGLLGAVAGAAVAWHPTAAGNGMEALRQSAVAVPVSLAVALAVGKLIGTTASLGAGSPGGTLTPTISIASGLALLTLLGIDAIGLAVAHPWDAMVASMAVGVAVGLRSPLVAVFLLPEMLGDYSLVPVIGLVVALAVVIDRGLDRVVRAAGRRIPTGIYDEDA